MSEVPLYRGSVRVTEAVTPINRTPETLNFTP